ncbi:MAG: OsmC family protein [Actinomycetes bacterium]
MPKATARSNGGSLSHLVKMRGHSLVADEPRDVGGEDSGPTPQDLLAASLASCTAITVQMYAQRKGWEIGPIEVDAEYEPAERGCPTKFTLSLRLPDDLDPEQRERLEVIAAKCPIHRALEGEVMFEECVESLAV